MRRAIGILLLTGLLLVLVWPLPALAGSSRATGAAASQVNLRADFNGDGAADLAIGALGENNEAGVVHVLYGSAGGLTAAGSQLWSQDSPGITGIAEPGDSFGEALTAGDFNGDGRADLAVGVPGENGLAGVVQVLYGSPTGLNAGGSQLWSQDSPGIVGLAEADDQFGSALTGGDFNGDSRADLAIGTPGENDFAGVVHVLYGTAAGGLTATGSQLWSQDSAGIAGLAEPFDGFGSALAAGDLNGDGRADLAIGTPGENDGAGVVHALYGSPTGLTATGSQLWSQDSPGIAGLAETGDSFGEALTTGDFNGDSRADLAIGAEGENDFAGVVQVLYGSPTGLTATGSQLWSQDSPGIAGLAEAGDFFGSALAAGDFNASGQADLAIGVPGENNRAGVVHALYGTAASGLTATGSQLWSQDSPGIAGVAESFDFFGVALVAGTLSLGGAGTTNPAVTSPAQRSRTAAGRNLDL